MTNEIITYDGTKALRSNCRRYNGQYYEIGRQCFKMPNGRYYRIDTDKIIYDYDTNKYVLKSDDYIKGIIGFNKDIPIYGYFKPNKFKNIDIHRVGIALSEKVINNNFVEILRNGRYVHKKHAPQKFNKITLGGSYSKDLDYSVSYRLNEITDTFNKHFEPEPIKPFWKELPNITVGIEYETYAGKIPEIKCMKNGLIPVKDGSLRRNGSISFEYATVILSKSNVLQAINEQTKLLNRYCKKSANESLHVHIGGYERSEEMLVALYRVVSILQDELYKMFPMFMRRTGVFKRNGKNYCKPLCKKHITYTDHDKDLNIIVSRLSDYNIDGDTYEVGMRHPVDPFNGHKWNVNSRYSICNLNHFAFAGSGTVEFRVHTNTFNKDKIAAWLFIIAAIVEYTNKIKNNVTFSTDITLNRIIDQVYSNKVLNRYLKAYIKYRKDLMKYNQNVHKDFIGILDVKNDNLNEFKFPVKELI